MLDVLRFWLERGVDGFRFDTVNFYFHDQRLRSNPPLDREASGPEINPYDMQDYLYSKNRPENLAFLKRIRKVMDEFGATATVGEVGEARRAVELMAAYTEGTERLHMAYSFDMLGPHYSATHFRAKLEEFGRGAPHGWPCWSFSNHDVRRHVTRWHEFSRDPDDLARQAGALLLSLRGSVCLYQGEELGLPEADILYEELTDPPGIRFWPEYKGRDGARTPIPWERGRAPNGFTTGKPWLPVKPPHSKRNVEDQNDDPGSVLAFYRAFIAFRRAHKPLVHGDIAFLEVGEPVLAFTRSHAGETLLAVFNLSAGTVTIDLGDHDAALLDVSKSADRHGTRLTLGPNGFAFLPREAGSATRPLQLAGIGAA